MLAASLLSACSDAGEPSAKPGLQEPSKRAELAKLVLPSHYDAGHGWDAVLPWLPPRVRSIPVTTAKSGGVGLLQTASGGYSVRLHDAATGRIRWSSKAWTPPAEVQGAEGDGSNAAEIPDLTTASAGGREYIVAWAHGMRGKDQLHNGGEVVVLMVYPADSQGEAVAPEREISVPVSARPGEVRVASADGALLVSWGGDGLYGTSAAGVDVSSGKVTSFGDADVLLPQCAATTGCSGSTVVSATAKGPVVAIGSGGFGVPGGWLSSSVQPVGVPAKSGFLGALNGRAYGASGSNLLASWRTGTSGDGTAVWTVHDVESGRIKAQMACATKGLSGSSGNAYAVVSSPNGSYVAAGPVAFDLKAKKGVCLQGDGNRKTIDVASISDDGVAYGAVEAADDSTRSAPVIAEVALKTGRSSVLKSGTEVPVAHAGSSGLIVRRDAADQVQVSLRRMR
ncbi:hypothetical protein PUR49_11170 [Streptomyces sp. BE147]|uniref:hypothetical protein n=1 Tax=Streptomyces sp. BE147 TaxID=3002524 RepID=UPI002E790A8D|nr:hypothetical protein [Streptomyces sp. BE147]MEE1737056.1 hypothetical protein [Streptomyces sp. BE147]